MAETSKWLNFAAKGNQKVACFTNLSAMYQTVLTLYLTELRFVVLLDQHRAHGANTNENIRAVQTTKHRRDAGLP